MAQLNQFNGGLSTRLAPHLININEAVVYENIDNSKVSLAPVKSYKDENTNVDKYFINFKDKWISSSTRRDYQKFQDKLYYSDSVGKPQKSSDGITWQNLGIDKPTYILTLDKVEAPELSADEPIANIVPNITGATLTSVGGGDLDEGVYSYKIVNIISGVTSIVYETTGTVSAGDSAISISNIIGTYDNAYVYRLYSGVYRLVGTTSGTLSDDTLDISGNSALVEYTEFPLGEELKYAYDAYDIANNLRTQVFNSITLSLTEKTYSVTLSATSDDTITYYRYYDEEYRECSSTDDTYVLTSAIKPDDIKYLQGTYQYSYTCYNSVDGTESQPSEYSEEITLTNGIVKVTGKGSSDSQVDICRLYRIGGNLISMSLVIELPNPGDVVGTYTDRLDDLSIEGSVLDSFNNAPAPTGLKYLTEHNAMFFGVKDDKLYFSDIAYVNYWSPFNFIDFDDTLTGLGATANGLLVFTKYKTYIVTGTSPLTLSKYLLSANQGCVEHRTISFAKNTLLWLSTDGICASSGGDIVVVSREKLGKLSISNPNDSVVYDDVYYLAHGNSILALDTRYGTILKDFSITAEGLSIHNDILYFVNSSKLYSMYQSDDYMSIKYISPKLSDGQVSNLKNYKTIYVKCTGTLTIKTYIDDNLVSTKSIDSKTTEILIPQQQRQGYYIQFEIEGTGELLELQYIVEGRQNGR